MTETTPPTAPGRTAPGLSLGDLWMLPVVLIWGVNLSLVKLALAEIPPLAFNGIRLAVASAVLMTCLWLSEGGMAIERRHRPRFLLLALSGHTSYQLLFILGIHLTTATNTALLLGTTPILVSLLSSFFKHEKIAPVGWLGIALGFLGSYLVIAGRGDGFRWSQRGLRGDLVVAVAVLLWSHYSVSSRQLLKTYTPLRFTALTMTLGSLAFLPFSFREITTLSVQAISWRAWACLVFSAVFALSLAVVIWFVSVKRVGNSQTAVYSNLQPVFGVLFAHALLGERLYPSLVAACAIIFLGIYLTRRGRKQ